jgi:hypothetical protein
MFMRTDYYVHENGQTTKLEHVNWPNNGTSVIMAPIETRKDNRITYAISLIQEQWDYNFCIWIMITASPGYHAMIWFPTFTDLRDYMMRYLPPKKTGITTWISNQISRIRSRIDPPPEKITLS